MTACVEMILWHHFTTGTLDYRMDPGDPWTPVQLSAPLPIRAALAEWAAAISAATAPETCEFLWADDRVTVVASSGDLELRLTPALAALFGFSGTTLGDGSASDLVPRGIANLDVSRGTPVVMDDREIEGHRAGRALSYGYGRRDQIDLQLVFPPALWPTLETSPIASGHAAVRATFSDDSPYGEDHPDGYLIAYPIAVAQLVNPGAGYHVLVTITYTLNDPGEVAADTQDTPWARFWAATRYGYGWFYWRQIEGIPALFGELAADAIAPDGYVLEAGEPNNPTRRNIGLSVDDTARVGNALDEANNLAKAFDCEARLFASPLVNAMFARPTLFATLTDDVTADDTTFPVDSRTDWPTADRLYIGTSAEDYAGLGLSSFSNMTRGNYGRKRSYKKGAIVTDAPYVWKGRKVDDYVTLLDPSGAYVQGENILDGALAVGSYYVDKRPWRDGPMWCFTARDQVRRLTQPLGVAASGEAKWSLDDDQPVAFDPETVITMSVTFSRNNASGVDETPLQFRPLQGLASPARRSVIMATFDAAVDAARGISGATWVPEYRDDTGIRIRWLLSIPVDVTDPDWDFVTVNVSPMFVSLSTTNWITWTPSQAMPTTGVSIYFVPTGLYITSQINSAGLSVTLDEGDATALPSQGMVMVEADDGTRYRRYSSLTVDPNDNATVDLVLDPSTFTVEETQRLASDLALNGPGDVSVKFFWIDTGLLPDILRRAIVSTGDAQNGFYDTLPKGQGLGLPHIDAGSFDNVFDAHFDDLNGVIASEAGTTLEDLVSGILRLSQRGIVSRRSRSGAQLQIAAISTGSADSAPVATITDSILVAGGKRPIRVVSLYEAPQAIQVKCRTLPINDIPEGEAAITAKDPHLVDWTGIRWELDIYGFSRNAILDAVKDWATAWFRAGENRQVLEVDVPPWIDAPAGSCVLLDCTDPTLWDYARGEPGIYSVARVIGAQMAMTTGVQTLTVVVDGIFGPGPMSPSLEIEAVTGTDTAPTSFDVPAEIDDTDILALLRYARGSSTTWKVLAYRPGQDAGHAEYTVSDIAAVGSSVRVTVVAAPSSPTIALTTDWRITWPVSAESTLQQGMYLHSDQRVQWS